MRANRSRASPRLWLSSLWFLSMRSRVSLLDFSMRSRFFSMRSRFFSISLRVSLSDSAMRSRFFSLDSVMRSRVFALDSAMRSRFFALASAISSRVLVPSMCWYLHRRGDEQEHRPQHRGKDRAQI